MITLNDFLDKGYTIDVMTTPNFVRRRLLEWEPDYKKVLEVANMSEDHRTRKDAIEEKFQGRYQINGWGGHAGKIDSVTAYFNDHQAIVALIEKGESSLELVINEYTNQVYNVRDHRIYFDGFMQYYHDINTKEETAEDVLKAVKERRQKDRRAMMNHYNRKIKELKQEYRHRLALVNAQIKENRE